MIEQKQMNNYYYWPYDELSILETSKAENYIIKTPWLELGFRQPQSSDPQWLAFLDRINNKTLDEHDLSTVSQFLANFKEHPISYILPSQKLALDEHTLTDKKHLNGDLFELLESILQISKKLEPELYKNHELLELKKALARTQWLWDHEAAVNFSSLGQVVHPESLYTVARRYHFLEVIENENGVNYLAQLQKLDLKARQKGLANFIRQNHYVTEHCQASLAPAQKMAQSSAKLVKDFMLEEKGHDRILNKALANLGMTPKNLLVSIQSRALMAMLKYAAGRNFLAFSMAVSSFEREPPVEDNALINALKNNGFGEAAKYMTNHSDINEEGGHADIAQSFLVHMKPCSKDYALEALRLMEIISLLHCSMSLVLLA